MLTANRKVATSTTRMPEMPIGPMSRPAITGDSTKPPNWAMLIMPLARVCCSRGTIMVTDAIWAGPWKDSAAAAMAPAR